MYIYIYIYIYIYLFTYIYIYIKMLQGVSRQPATENCPSSPPPPLPPSSPPLCRRRAWFWDAFGHFGQETAFTTSRVWLGIMVLGCFWKQGMIWTMWDSVRARQ